MKLGYIDYLNCYPFYYHMLEKDTLADVEIIPAYPSDLNRMMSDGTLDMSPVSSAVYAELQKEVMILPDFCLSSIGYVRSVILISRLPIEELDGRRVGLSTASRTSVVLLKILLEKYYGLRPHYLPAMPSPSLKEIDAALVIGNEALQALKEPVPYVYDLGDLWLRKTGHPVVFAVFTVRRDIIERNREPIRHIIDSYNRSLRCLRTERDALIAAARRKYPEIHYDIDTYYRLLKFELTGDLKKALEFYFREAAELGLLERVKRLEYLGTA